LDEWVSLERARGMRGLRLVLLRGLPSPWSMAARAVFEICGVPYVKVWRAPDDPPALLREWTGQESFPAAMYADERPRTGWAEILLLADRLRTGASLLPADARERALALGLCHELCGELGLVWCRRLLGMAPRLAESPRDPHVLHYAYWYGSGPLPESAARARVIEVLALLADQLGRQRAAGSRFLVGKALSAADVHWAAASNVISLLAQEKLPLDPAVRAGFTTDDRAILAALDPALLAHRDFVVEGWLKLPLEV
jgi:glutathione S-transferase